MSGKVVCSDEQRTTYPAKGAPTCSVPGSGELQCATSISTKQEEFHAAPTTCTDITALQPD
jgi:hypothetical protein